MSTYTCVIGSDRCQHKSNHIQFLHYDNRQIQIKYCVTKHDGIPLHPARVDDHQEMIKILDKSSYDYHTSIFKLSEGKTLGALPRSIRQVFSTVEVRLNLKVVEFKLNPVVWMHKLINGTQIDQPVILVQLFNSAKNRNVFSLSKLGHMLNKMELQEIRKPISRYKLCRFQRMQIYPKSQISPANQDSAAR